MPDIFIGRNDHAQVVLKPRYGNRHGMMAGATGTGKSVSLIETMDKQVARTVGSQIGPQILRGVLGGRR